MRSEQADGAACAQGYMGNRCSALASTDSLTSPPRLPALLPQGIVPTWLPHADAPCLRGPAATGERGWCQKGAICGPAALADSHLSRCPAPWGPHRTVISSCTLSPLDSSTRAPLLSPHCRELHIREDERHGRLMLDDVAIPLAEMCGPGWGGLWRRARCRWRQGGSTLGWRTCVRPRRQD